MANNTLRITSGALRGRVISTPGGATHPMGERERLALFNMISEYLDGALVLDLYAGSGALGIEALSRGAREVTFVEKSAQAARVIEKNLRELGLSAPVIRANVKDFRDADAYDVVLADPPYDDFHPEDLVRLGDFVASNGILVLSHPGAPVDLPELHLLKTRQYARANISVYQKLV